MTPGADSVRATAAASARTSWWPFLAVALAYAAVATWQITLPGIYMDAVNPDYLVVKILNRDAQPITAWVLSANYLGNLRYPVLIALYHGSLQFWLGLPLFWILGTDVVALRVAHALFALAVLASVYAVLARAGMRRWVAALACIALALDPAFSYAFRTQSYITLAASAWMLFGLAAVLRANDPAGTRRSLLWFGGGVLYGISIFGYFIYAFFFPALLYAVLARADAGARDRMRALLIWGTGLALGLAGYWLGYGLIIHERHGLAGFLRFVGEQQNTLGAFKSTLAPLDRVAYAWGMLESVLHNWWHHMLMFGEATLVPGAAAKTLLLVALPAGLWLYAQWRRRASAVLNILVAMVVSFFAIALLFGNRLGGHHFVVLLPLLYAALAVGWRDAAGPTPNHASRLVAVVPLLLLSGFNLAGQASTGAVLAATGGVGLYSDANNRLAADLDARERKPFVYFPDWGLSMPVAFLTRGRIGMDSIENFAAARTMLCGGRDVAVAIINGDRVARIESWRQSLGWDAPSIVVYRQADGRDAFSLATFRGRTDGPGCGG